MNPLNETPISRRGPQTGTDYYRVVIVDQHGGTEWYTFWANSVSVSETGTLEAFGGKGVDDMTLLFALPKGRWNSVTLADETFNEPVALRRLPFSTTRQP